MLELIIGQDVSKVYHTGEVPVNALKGVSFSIPKGAFLAIIGPSGSGKTTLLNLIGCLDKPSGGRLLVAGTDVADLGKTDAAVFRGSHIGFIFQGFNLIPVLTAYENVEYPLFMVKNVVTVHGFSGASPSSWSGLTLEVCNRSGELLTPSIAIGEM